MVQSKLVNKVVYIDDLVLVTTRKNKIEIVKAGSTAVAIIINCMKEKGANLATYKTEEEIIFRGETRYER